MVPWGVQRNRWVYWHKHVKTWSKKHGDKKVGNGKKPSGRCFFFFYLIVEKYVVILLFKFIEKQFLNVMLKGVDGSS